MFFPEHLDLFYIIEFPPELFNSKKYALNLKQNTPIMTVRGTVAAFGHIFQ
jgi:hypothetical protein